MRQFILPHQLNDIHIKKRKAFEIILHKPEFTNEDITIGVLLEVIFNKTRYLPSITDTGIISVYCSVKEYKEKYKDFLTKSKDGFILEINCAELVDGLFEIVKYIL